jgi:V-ATPase subunit C
VLFWQCACMHAPAAVVLQRLLALVHTHNQRHVPVLRASDGSTLVHSFQQGAHSMVQTAAAHATPRNAACAVQAKNAEFQQAKQAFTAANRKTGGSLATRDLRSIVPNEDAVDTENIGTVVVTVPSYSVKEFTASYETWADMVVPRSAKTVASDGDYVLKRVLLFKRFLDDFKQNARLKGCQVCIANVCVVGHHAGSWQLISRHLPCDACWRVALQRLAKVLVVLA